MDEPYLSRFLSRIDKTEDCWLWTRGKTTAGYGQFYIPKPIYAHRASYEHFAGPIPEGMEVAHLCNVKACIRPEHLTLMTHAENMAHLKISGYARGSPGNTRTRGSKSYRALLTEEQVYDILCDTRSQSVIAAEYGVAISTVKGIRQRRTWTHVEPPPDFERRPVGRPRR
jgi:hypothetical protein